MWCSVRSNRTIINFSKRLNAATHTHTSARMSQAIERSGWNRNMSHIKSNACTCLPFHSGAHYSYAYIYCGTRRVWQCDIGQNMWTRKKRGIKLTNLYIIFSFAFCWDACDAEPTWTREANRKKISYNAKMHPIASAFEFQFLFSLLVTVADNVTHTIIQQWKLMDSIWIYLCNV